MALGHLREGSRTTILLPSLAVHHAKLLNRWTVNKVLYLSMATREVHINFFDAGGCLHRLGSVPEYYGSGEGDIAPVFWKYVPICPSMNILLHGG
jgi:hypothetical protein